MLRVRASMEQLSAEPLDKKLVGCLLILLEIAMVENGHMGRDSYGTEEKVAEGEVKEKYCGGAPEVGELVAVPGEDYGSWKNNCFKISYHARA